MLREEQTHSLPESETDRARIALGLGFADWGALLTALERHRGAVRDEFARVFEARDQSPRGAPREDVAALDLVWIDPEDAAAPQRLAQAGFTDAAALAQRLVAFRRLPALSGCRRRRRPARCLMPRLLDARRTALRRTPRRCGRWSWCAVLRRPAIWRCSTKRPPRWRGGGGRWRAVAGWPNACARIRSAR